MRGYFSIGITTCRNSFMDACAYISVVLYHSERRYTVGCELELNEGAFASREKWLSNLENPSGLLIQHNSPISVAIKRSTVQISIRIEYLYSSLHEKTDLSIFYSKKYEELTFLPSV